MTKAHKIAIGAALIGVAAMNLGGLPLAGAATSTTTTLPPCRGAVIDNCTPISVKADVPRGYSIPKKPRDY